MAVRYNSTTKFGELDVVDNEGRIHTGRFGGPGTGQNVKTDIVIAGDPTCPNQLSVITPNAPQGQINVTAETVTFSNNAIDVVLYTRLGDALTQSELQMDINLKTRAAANAAASFGMQFSGHEFFDFIYITPFVPVYEEIKRGQPWVYNYDRAQYLIDPASVPEPPGGYIGRQKWHNGGYHVKHKTWKNHRNNSTYCIISVPKLTDALGAESWGSLSFNPATGVMTYINDATFLATRTLPITLDPTFGDTTAGTDTFPMSNDRVLVGIFTAPEAGTVDSVHFYSGNGTQNQKGVVFATSAGAPTGDPVVVGGVVANASTPAWRTSTAASESITAVAYGIGAVAAGGAADEWYKDVSGGNDSYLDNANSYATPNSWATTSNYGGQMNAYLTYTASSGGIVEPIPSKTLRLTSFAPNTYRSMPEPVPSKTLRLTSFAPNAAVVIPPIVKQVPSKTLRLTGIAPADYKNIVRAIPAGALRLTGIAPLDYKNLVKSVPSTTLRLTGLAPTDYVTAPGSVIKQIPSTTLRLTGIAPLTYGLIIKQIPSATLRLTGYAPSDSIVIPGLILKTIPSAQLRLVSFNPSFTGTEVEAPSRPAAGGKYRHRPQRLVIIGKKRYRVDSYDQEVRLLQNYLKEQRQLLDEEQIRSDKPSKKTIRLLKSKIEKVETKLAKAHESWQNQITQENEDIILMLVA